MSVLDRFIQGNVVMKVDDMYEIANYADLHVQPIRKLSITVEVLDDNDSIVATIQGFSTGGSLDVAGDSLIKRTGSITFVLVDDLLPESEKRLLWMTNKIRVYAGIEDLSTNDGTITHFCLGTFYIGNYGVSISSDSRTISIKLEDYMMKWDNTELENMMVFEAGTPLNTAVRSLMELYGEFNHRIEFTSLSIPYKMEFSTGTSIMEILTQLRDLYMDWHCYYDTDGTFVFEKVEIQKEYAEPVMWSFENRVDLSLSFSEDFNYRAVRNRVVVMGEMDDHGDTPKSEAFISNEDSPFHKDNLGEERTTVIVDSSLKTAVQCDAKARYELFKASTFQEQANISTIPIYYLDTNNLIEIVNYATGEKEKYVINSISIGLEVGAEMTLNCSKVYYNHFDIDSDLGSYRDWANVIIEGITNKGWLHLGEDKIREWYGLEASGEHKLIVNFEYREEGGGTASVTGSLYNRNQSLVIDLADYKDIVGENGHNGFGKEEYLDRVLAHEMVHAVMNDVYTVTKTVQIQDWFKEGMAELIHGADERLKISIGNEAGTGIDATRLNNIINIAVNLLEDAKFQGESDYYSASYIICKFLNRRWSTGKTIKNLMHSIRLSNDSGASIVKNAILENTDYATFEDFIADFRANVEDVVRYSMALDHGRDEEDTGSIAGYDEDGVQRLNAEDVIDNSLAVEGLLATGFKVEINSI